MSVFKEYEKLKDSLNKSNSFKGIISEIPWQHLVASIKDYPHAEYFDLEDGFQTIIYSKEKILSKTKLLVTGTVIEVKGRSKRPTDEEEKNYSEYHILVNEYRVLTEN